MRLIIALSIVLFSTFAVQAQSLSLLWDKNMTIEFVNYVKSHGTKKDSSWEMKLNRFGETIKLYQLGNETVVEADQTNFGFKIFLNRNSGFEGNSYQLRMSPREKATILNPFSYEKGSVYAFQMSDSMRNECAKTAQNFMKWVVRTSPVPYTAIVKDEGVLWSEASLNMTRLKKVIHVMESGSPFNGVLEYNSSPIRVTYIYSNYSLTFQDRDGSSIMLELNPEKRLMDQNVVVYIQKKGGKKIEERRKVTQEDIDIITERFN